MRVGSILGGVRYLGGAIALVALILVVGQRSQQPAMVHAQLASPSISVTFGLSEVWTPSNNAITALHSCQNQDFSCVQPIMQADGASDDAVAFYRLTEWFLADIQNTGVVQLATVFNPWRANENDQPALLGGMPIAIYPEQLSVGNQGDAENDPAYQALKAANPDLLFWTPGPSFEGTDVSPEGGQRFIFDYRLLNGCHACAILGLARYAFDFAPDGTFANARYLSIAPPANGGS